MGAKKSMLTKKKIGTLIVVCLLMFSMLFYSVQSQLADDFEDYNENSITETQPINNQLDGSTRARAELDLENWLMFLGDNRNTGYSAAEVPNINHTIWINEFKDKNGEPIPFYSSPVIYGDQIFIGADDHNFYSFDKYSGNINWKVKLDGLVTQTSGPIESTPTIYNDKIYFGCDDKNLYCLNMDNGSLNWSFEADHYIKSSPKIYNDTVVFGCYGNPGSAKIYALNATTGAHIWNMTGPGEGNFHATPAIDDGLVYFGFERKGVKDSRSTIFALFINNGTILWNVTTSNGIYSSITVTDDKVFTADLDGNVYAFFKNNGTQVWMKSTGGQIYSSPAVDIKNNILYIGSNVGDLFTYDLNTGYNYWKFPVQTPGSSQKFSIQSPIILAKDHVFFGAANKRIYCLNATKEVMTPTYRLIWQYDTGGFPTSACAPVNGFMFTASESGRIFAFANPDLNASAGFMTVSEDAPYPGEFLEVTGKVVNDGSLELSGIAKFFYHLTFSFGQGPPEKILISQHPVTLDVGESAVFQTTTNVPKRDWSVVTNSVILFEIGNVSFKESRIDNNIDLYFIDVLDYYNDDWINYQRNNARTGLGDFGSITNKTIWQFDTATSATGGFLASPLHGKGRVFLASTSGSVYSLLDGDGKIDWSHDFGSKITGTPAMLMNTVSNKNMYEKLFFGTENGRVYALTINQGMLNWSFNTGGKTITGSPLIMNGMVFIGTTTGEFYALDEDGLYDGDQGVIDSNQSLLGGDLLWTITLPSGTKTAPAFYNDILIVSISGSGGNRLVAIHQKTGSIYWSYEFDSAIQGSPIINTKNNQVYISVDDNYIYTFDILGLSNGNQGTTDEVSIKNNNADILWKFNCGAKNPATGALDSDNNRLVFGTETGKIIAIDIKNGTTVWEYNASGKFTAPPTIANDLIYAGSDNGILFCLREFRENKSAPSPDLVWKLDTGSSIKAPIICDNFASYLATTDGTLYKLGAPNTPPKAIIDKPYQNQTFFVDDNIILDGSSSFDPEDGKSLSYLWTFKPKGQKENFITLYNKTKEPLVSFPLNSKITKAGDYTINLTVFDSYDAISQNSTNITVFEPLIRMYKNDSIPAWCRLLFSGDGGVDLYASKDPKTATGSVGNISKFASILYSTLKPLYKVRWYNVSVGYSNQDLPEEYNVSRARLFKWDPDTKAWQKCDDTGIDLSTKQIWANISGLNLEPYKEQLFAPGTLDNSPPTIKLIQKGVSPFNGTRDESYEYLVEYFDLDSDLPTLSSGGYLKIDINGKLYDMEETNVNDTDTSDGKYYTFSIAGSNLRPENANTFKILAHDGTYLFKTQLYTGPNIETGSAPDADAGPDQTVKAGKSFWLDASGSTDIDDDIVKFLWDTDGDGDFYDSDGSREGLKVSLIIQNKGIYIITLKVIDEEGNNDTDTVTITVEEDKDVKQDDDLANILLYIGIIILIIVILLIVALMFYRKKLQDERERRLFEKGPPREDVLAEEEAEEPMEDEDLDEEDLDDVEEVEFSEEPEIDVEDDEELEDFEVDEEDLEELEEFEAKEPKKADESVEPDELDELDEEVPKESEVKTKSKKETKEVKTKEKKHKPEKTKVKKLTKKTMKKKKR